VFQELKLRRNYKYLTFKISNDKTEIVVEKKSTFGDYDKFLADLPENECRWAVYDFEFEKEDGGRRNKIVFYSWCVPSTRPTHPTHPSVVAIVYRRQFLSNRHHRRHSGA
jgi:hypothetical protein